MRVCMRALYVLVSCIYDLTYKYYTCIYSTYSMVDVCAQAGILEVTYLGLWLRKHRRVCARYGAS